MKKNGFTLIELLAVITILSLIALVTSISVANMVKESKDELSDAQMKSIKAAAESWGADNISDLPTGNSCSYIVLNDLKEDGLLDSNITDPKSKNIISNDLKIKITSKVNGKGKSVLTYEVNPTNVNNCTYIGSPLYVEVPDGLTPVIYVDESTETNPTAGYWKVPELNEEWYNYDKQMWANAVVLGQGKNKKPGEKVVVEGESPDALMMLVYIPRYEYRIVNTSTTYGTHIATGEPGTQNTPGEIEVKFINSSQTKSDDDYILHPAFNFDGTKSGFWVGKFEMSSKSADTTSDNNLGCSSSGCAENAVSNLRILPNVTSLRYNSVSNFFYAIRSIENDNTFGLSNMDTHMMKNSEWGAVAYLSQSKYGKYGNNDYAGAQKEVYINNSWKYITGRSGGNVGGNTPANGTYTNQSSSAPYNDYGYYTYDGYLLNFNTNTKSSTKEINKGTGASTTGNIYGVYDMSGGAWEFVMGSYGLQYPTIEGSGFAPSNVFTSGTINTKYYDLYKTNIATTACNNGGVCYGHALSETSGWYNDTADMIKSNEPWFIRGGMNSMSTNAGIFFFGTDDSDGSSSFGISTRFVGFGK